MPADLTSRKLKRKENAHCSANIIVCMMWKDKNTCLLSTQHKATNIKTTG
jgi:hypothetical protein